MHLTTPENIPNTTQENNPATWERILRNAHPTPSPARLATIDGRVIVELVVIVARETVSPERRVLAGLPPLEALAAELRRRASAGQAVGR